MTTTIAKRFVNTFLVLSALSLIVIYIVRLLFFKELYIIKTGGILSFLIVGILNYFSYFPYILALSSYRAYFYSKDIPVSSTVGHVSQNAMIAAAVIIVFYGVFMLFFSSFLIDSMYSMFLQNKYKEYFKYQKEGRENLLAEGRDAFYKNNFTLANKIAKEALFFNPDDSDVMIFIRDIRNTESKYLSQFATKEKIAENNEINNGAKYFASKDYTKAENAFLRALKINKENEIAKYYLNQIAVATGKGIDKYKGKTNTDIKVYDRLSLGITYYNDGNYWKAYNIFSDLYSKYPENIEIFNYYRFVLTAIRSSDFFIEDAENIYSMFMTKDGIAKRNMDNINSSTGKNGMLSHLEYTQNLSLLKTGDDYIYTSIVLFFGEIYLFDTSIVKVAPSYDNISYDTYRLGKLVTNASGGHTMLLKAKYQKDDTSFNSNNEVYVNSINFDVSPRTFEILKEYSTLNYRPISDIFVLLKDMPKLGYSKSNLVFLLVNKLFAPIIMLLIIIIISYYSFKYRMKDNVHLYHHVIGFLGTIILTYLIKEMFDYTIKTISAITNPNSLYIILGIISLCIVFIYSIRFFRIDLNR